LEVPKHSGKIDEREKQIGDRLRLFRERITWSQKAFAEQIGLTRDQLAHIEYHRTPMRYDVAWKIRQAFGLSADWLWGGGEEPGDLGADEKLPLPDATGLPPNALLTEVVKAVHNLSDDDIYTPKTRRSRAAMAKFGGSDIKHRSLMVILLKLRLRDWLARVPEGYTRDFHDKIVQLADTYLKALPEEPRQICDERFEALQWEEMRSEIATRLIELRREQKKDVDDVTDYGKHEAVKPTLAALLRRLNKATAERGMKSQLARHLGVPLSNVSQWLSGEREPSGETTLLLLHWVEQRERQQTKSPGSVVAPPGPKTRLRSSSDEKPKPSPPKR
jgi:transcriptional regulator with XRE-family HTH domain